MSKTQIEVARYEKIIKNNINSISIVNDCINDIIKISRWVMSIYSKVNTLQMQYGKNDNYIEVLAINISRYVYENKKLIINKLKHKNSEYLIHNNKTITDAEKVLSDYDTTYKIIKYILSDLHNANKYAEIREKYRYLSKDTFSKNVEKVIELMNISNVSRFIFSTFVYSILSLLDFKEIDKYIEKHLEKSDEDNVEKVLIEDESDKKEDKSKVDDKESDTGQVNKEEEENIKRIGKKIKGLNIKQKTKKKKSKGKGILGGIFDTFKDILSGANKTGNFLLDILNQIKSGTFNPIKSGLELLKNVGNQALNFAGKIVGGIADFFLGKKKQDLMGIFGAASGEVMSGVSDIENKKINIENNNTRIISTSIDNLTNETKKFTEQSQANATKIQEQNQVRNDELKKIEATLSEKMDSYANELKNISDVLDSRLAELSGSMSSVSESIDSQVGAVSGGASGGGGLPVGAPVGGGLRRRGRKGGMGGRKGGKGGMVRRGGGGESVTQASRRGGQTTPVTSRTVTKPTAEAKMPSGGKPESAPARGGGAKPGPAKQQAAQGKEAGQSAAGRGGGSQGGGQPSGGGSTPQAQQKQDTSGKTTQPTSATPKTPGAPETKGTTTPQAPDSKKDTKTPPEPGKGETQTKDAKALADEKIQQTTKRNRWQEAKDKFNAGLQKIKRGAEVVIDVAQKGWEYASQLIETYLPTIMNVVYSTLKAYITFDVLMRSFRANAVFGPFNPDNQLFEKEKREAEKKGLKDRLGGAESRRDKISLGNITGETGRGNMSLFMLGRQGNIAEQINNPVLRSVESSLQLKELPMAKQENLYSLKSIKYDMESRKRDLEELKTQLEKMKEDMAKIREINSQLSKSTQEMAAKANQNSAVYYTIVSKSSANAIAQKTN